MIDGKVKFFASGKGYGFISSPELDDDCFFHHSVIKGENPTKDDLVVFDYRDGEKGFEAISVKIKEEE